MYGQKIDFKNHPYGSLGKDNLLSANTSIGDIDNDGDVDIAVANGRHWSQFNQIFYNDGSGFFRRSKLIGFEANTSYLANLVDVDNDKDLDIVVANDRIKNQIFKNDGKGNFTFDAFFGRQISNTRGVCLADLNSDGFMDIAEANRKSQNFIYFNDGRGRFKNEIAFGDSFEATINIVASDVNQDGNLDLILANRNKQTNRIYFGPAFKDFIYLAKGMMKREK